MNAKVDSFGKSALGHKRESNEDQFLIADSSTCHRDLHGMGTTLTGALIMRPLAFIFHVGDSRCYLCRQGRLQQLTTDHTLASLFESVASRAEIDASCRHVLHNALGVDTPEISVELLEKEIQATHGLSTAQCNGRLII